MDKSTFQLDPKDVLCSEGSGKSGRRKARLPRSASSSDGYLELTHAPTGISVTGDIPRGHYTRKQMRAIRRDVYERLLAALTDTVAKELRVPGR